jgi:hypothetical protein
MGKDGDARASAALASRFRLVPRREQSARRTPDAHRTAAQEAGAVEILYNFERVLRRRGWTFPPLRQYRAEWEKRFYRRRVLDDRLPIRPASGRLILCLFSPYLLPNRCAGAFRRKRSVLGPCCTIGSRRLMSASLAGVSCPIGAAGCASKALPLTSCPHATSRSFQAACAVPIGSF